MIDMDDILKNFTELMIPVLVGMGFVCFYYGLADLSHTLFLVAILNQGVHHRICIKEGL